MRGGEESNAATPDWRTGAALLLQAFAGVPAHDYWMPMILTVPSLCMALLCPFAGILADRFGRRRLLLAALVVYAIVGIAPVLLQTLPQILLSRVGAGVAEALIDVLSTTMIGDTFSGAARDRWLAGQTAFASVSALLFFNIGGILGEIGWRTPFWVYLSALAMLALVPAFTRETVAGEAGADEPLPTRSTGSWQGFP